MEPNATTNSGAGQGQPANSAPLNPQGQEQAQSNGEFVTRAELDAVMQKIDETRRASQSQNDKLRNQVDERIQKIVDAYGQAGIPMSADRAKALIAQEQAAVPNEQGQPQAEYQAAQNPGEAAASFDPQETAVIEQAITWLQEDGAQGEVPAYLLEGYRMMAAAGVHLDDPEALQQLKAIDPNKNPGQWLGKLDNLIQSRVQRNGQSGSAARMPAAANGVPIGQPAHYGRSAREQLQMGFDQ